MLTHSRSVRHLEHRLLHREIFFTGAVHMDPMVGYLYTVAQTDLCESVGNLRNAGTIQAQSVGVSNLECHYHIHVPRTSAQYRPCSASSLCKHDTLYFKYLY